LIPDQQQKLVRLDGIALLSYRKAQVRNSLNAIVPISHGSNPGSFILLQQKSCSEIPTKQNYHYNLQYQAINLFEYSTIRTTNTNKTYQYFEPLQPQLCV